MLEKRLQAYQKAAHRARLGELPPGTIRRLLKHMAELQIGRKYAVHHGRVKWAECARRGFQILGRGLADALSVPALKICEIAEEIAEANGHQRREELTAALTLPSNDSE